MKVLKSLVLYAALALGANTARADVGALIALAEDDLAKIVFHASPKPLPETVFWDENGGEVTLDAYRGKHVLLNFWALWCAPCVREMPALDRLDAAVGGADFEVVTITTGRNSRPAVDKFFVEKSLDHLPKLFDPKMTLARDVRALGLPVSILIGPDGGEIARAQGEVEWDSLASQNLFRTWIAAGS